MTPTKDDSKPVDEATHDSGNRDADHGTCSDRHQLHRGVRKIQIEPSEVTPPVRKAAPASANQRTRRNQFWQVPLTAWKLA